ncbi:PREDICTED: DNA damage-inducible transcript 3 protein [Sturnus vulgaris]|uniref:DNA damage-inducible transcript 3 protein n=1 Tax=Sturnus vulgaris TaxID=9172 RepID=UPI00071A99B4|nr:PREDICTED: DNA damage-inducible transcript 3 protein [Sturnus vulgaris]
MAEGFRSVPGGKPAGTHPPSRDTRAGPEVPMAAEGLWGPGGPPGWELDGWYQDLQEVLAAEPPGAAPTWGAEQVDPGPGGCGLDLALAEELLELLGPEGAEEEEEEEARGARRKRRGGAGAPRERDGERRVRELTAHNERLRAEIQRLSAEVQRTRAALIDRIVNLRQV